MALGVQRKSKVFYICTTTTIITARIALKGTNLGLVHNRGWRSQPKTYVKYNLTWKSQCYIGSGRESYILDRLLNLSFLKLFGDTKIITVISTLLLLWHHRFDNDHHYHHHRIYVLSIKLFSETETSLESFRFAGLQVLSFWSKIKIKKSQQRIHLMSSQLKLSHHRVKLQPSKMKEQNV